MYFLVDKNHGRIPIRPEKSHKFPVIVIKKDNWNDYGYFTHCILFIYMDHESEPIRIGSTKIMFKGQKEGTWVFEELMSRFSKLDNIYCSLSSDLTFYENIKNLKGGLPETLLKNIRDAAYDQKIWNKFNNDTAFQVSLLREKSQAIETRDLFKKMFKVRKNAINKFTYKVKLLGAVNHHEIKFDFRATSLIPNRIMLLVGSNGSGKTQLLSKLAIALTGITAEEGTHEDDIVKKKRMSAGFVNPIPSFYEVIAVSFNAFDKFEIPKVFPNSKFRYTYCGIRNDSGVLCTEDELMQRIKEAVTIIASDKKRQLTRTIKRVLNIEITDEKLLEDSGHFYEKLSAGQRIVLNVLTHLIVNLRERSLVLLDEPETHLHPGLMSTLIDEILILLKSNKSYAIIATHSPIIAQQVPSKYIRIISRIDDYVQVTMPKIECFGENLSQITTALFESKEYERDYTNVIERLLRSKKNDPEKVEELFPRGLGSNARVFLLSCLKDDKIEKY